MRTLDLLEDVEATSRRLHLRGGFSDSDLARMTADTLLRADLTRWLQTSIGERLRDPGERLMAMILRMAEVTHAPATTCAFGEDFDGLLQPCSLPRRAYARHFSLAGFPCAEQGRDLLDLDTTAADPSNIALDLLCASTIDEARLSSVMSFAFGPAARSTTCLILSDWRLLLNFAEQWRGDGCVVFAGPVLHGAAITWGGLYATRRDRRD